MFIIASLIFIIFGVFYALFSSAIIYHLRQYTLPGYPAPRLIIALFLTLSVLLGGLAFYFLWHIPK